MTTVSVGAAQAMRLIGAYCMEDSVPLAAWMDIGGDGIAADLLGCPQTMKAIGKPVSILVKIDIDRRELDALLIGLGVFIDHRIVQFRAGLGAFG